MRPSPGRVTRLSPNHALSPARVTRWSPQAAVPLRGDAQVRGGPGGGPAEGVRKVSAPPVPTPLPLSLRGLSWRKSLNLDALTEADVAVELNKRHVLRLPLPPRGDPIRGPTGRDRTNHPVVYKVRVVPS
eukprot:7700388-Pyramimonas_sp.AAC.1